MPLVLTRSVPAQLDAGKLDRRVTLLKPIYNSYGDEITGWEAVADVWAAVTVSTGREQNEADRIVALTTAYVIIRHRTDVDARWRVQDGPYTWEVRALADLSRLRVTLQLTCTEVQ